MANTATLVIAITSVHLTSVTISQPLIHRPVTRDGGRNSFKNPKHESDSAPLLHKNRSSSGLPLLTPSLFPLPCAMAPSQLKTYLETIVNSTLHPRDNEASLHDAYGNMDYGNALPIRLDFKDSHSTFSTSMSRLSEKSP